jgi:hypothetical protein
VYAWIQRRRPLLEYQPASWDGHKHHQLALFVQTPQQAIAGMNIQQLATTLGTVSCSLLARVLSARIFMISTYYSKEYILPA